MLLSEAEEGDYIIKHVRCVGSSNSFLTRLAHLGIYTGIEIHVNRSLGSTIIFTCKNIMYFVNKEASKRIEVFEK